MDGQIINLDQIEINGKDVLYGILMIAGFLAMVTASFLSVVSVAPRNAEQGNQSNLIYKSDSGIATIGSGGLKYNYEWGWYNYATGTFEVKVLLQSFDSGACGYRWDPSFSVTRTVNDNAKISSQNNGANLWYPNQAIEKSLSRSYDTVFTSSDFFTTNVDNVLLEFQMCGTQGNTYMKGSIISQGNTVIDWANILHLIASAAGS